MQKSYFIDSFGKEVTYNDNVMVKKHKYDGTQYYVYGEVYNVDDRHVRFITKGFECEYDKDALLYRMIQKSIKPAYSVSVKNKTLFKI